MDVENLNPAELNEVTIDFLILADRAEAVNGKVYIMGGAWDRSIVQDFGQPVFLSFAVGILVPWNATNRHHTLTVVLEDSDRNPVPGFNLTATFVAGRPAVALVGEPQMVTMAIPVAPVTFPGPGTYQAVASIDNGPTQSVRRVRFSLHPSPAIIAPAH